MHRILRLSASAGAKLGHCFAGRTHALGRSDFSGARAAVNSRVEIAWDLFAIGVQRLVLSLGILVHFTMTIKI